MWSAALSASGHHRCASSSTTALWRRWRRFGSSRDYAHLIQVPPTGHPAASSYLSHLHRRQLRQLRHTAAMVSSSPSSAMSWRRDFSKVTDSKAVEYYLEDIEGAEDPLGDVRNFMFPESEDERLEEVSHAGSVEEVFAALDREEGEWGLELSFQAVATLFHLHKRCGHPDSPQEERGAPTLRDFNVLLERKGRFRRLAEAVGKHFKEIDLGRLAYCFMCLRRMNVGHGGASGSPQVAEVIRDIQIHLSRNFDEMELTGMAYFAVALRGRNMQETPTRETSLTWGLAMAPAMPRIARFIAEAESPEDLRKLAICINATCRIASDAIMDAFDKKVAERIDAGAFSSEALGLEGDEASSFDDLAVQSLCKILSVALGKKRWFTDKVNFSRKVLLQLKGRTHLMRPLQALVASKVCYIMAEPVSMFYDVNRRIEELYDQGVDETQTRVSKLDLLRALATSRIRSFDKEELLTLMKEGLRQEESWQWEFNNVFDIIRSTSVCDQELQDLLFSRGLELSEREDSGLEVVDLVNLVKGIGVVSEAEEDVEHSGQLNTRLALRYMHFTTYINGHIRDRHFEERLMQRFESTMGDCPFVGKFGAGFSFLLAYSRSALPPELLKKFHSMMPNMEPMAMYTLAKAVAIQRRKRASTMDPELLAQLDEITTTVSKRCLHLLGSKNQGQDFWWRYMLFLSLIAFNRDRGYEEEMQAVMKVVFSDVNHGNLTFSVIRRVTMDLIGVTHVIPIPGLLNDLIRYIVENRVHLHSLNLLRPLRLCYLANHRLDPSLSSFLTICNNCLLRDFHTLRGGEIILACTSLIRYRALSRELAEAVFSDQFMDLLDREMSLSEEKSAYPAKVRKNLMNLNRAVVLMCPEYGIPWFHDHTGGDRSESRLRPLTVSSYELKDQVYERLSAALGGGRFIRENVVSPYHDRFDFEVVLDPSDGGRPVDLNSCSSSGAPFSADRHSSSLGREGFSGMRHLAVIVAREDRQLVPTAEEEGGGWRLSGNMELKVETLELEGYEVIVITSHEWNAMNMAEEREQEKFLLKRIRGAAAS